MPLGDLVGVFVRGPHAVASVALGVQKGFVAGGKRNITCLIASEQVAVGVEVGFEGNLFGGVRGVLHLDDDNGVEVVSYHRVVRVGDELFPDDFYAAHGIAERHGDDYYDCYHHGNRNDTRDDFFLSCVVVGVRRVVVSVVVEVVILQRLFGLRRGQIVVRTVFLHGAPPV